MREMGRWYVESINGKMVYMWQLRAAGEEWVRQGGKYETGRLCRQAAASRTCGNPRGPDEAKWQRSFVYKYAFTNATG